MGQTVHYLTNDKGEKKAVVVPIRDYEKLLEDLEDFAVIAERRDEQTIPQDEFRKDQERLKL